MKDGLKYLIGKRISGVVVATSKREPRQQVFLVFTDGSRFEFYGESFSCCSGLDDAPSIKRYVDSAQGKITQVYDQPPGNESKPAVPLSTSAEIVQHAEARLEALTSRMKRDLEAWTLAKAAIAKARRGL